MSDDNSNEPEIDSPFLKPYSARNRSAKTRQKKQVQILELFAKEVPVPVIADAVQLSVTSVRDVLKKFEGVFSNLDRVDDFRKSKADILSASQLTVLESALSGDKLDRASFITTLQGFEILNKAERLDLGKSTENHAHSIFGKINVQNNGEDEWFEPK